MTETAGRLMRPIERGSRTLYLLTPITYEGTEADDEAVAQGFDNLVRALVAEGRLVECGVTSVGFCVIQPTGDYLPIGIE